MNFGYKRLEPWEKIIPSFKYNREQPFFEMLVPTTDTVRYGYLMEKLLSVRRSVLFTGGTGVGKVRIHRYSSNTDTLRLGWQHYNLMDKVKLTREPKYNPVLIIICPLFDGASGSYRRKSLPHHS